MQQRQNARQLMMIGGGVIAFVLVIAFFLSHRGGSGSASAEKTDTVPVVVASQTVPTGTVFKAGQKLSDLFTVKQVPSSLAPFGAYTKVQSIENLTKTPGCGPVKADGCDGQVTTVQTIYQGTPVVSGMFTTLGQYRAGPGPSFAIPYGYVAIAVTMDAQDSVLGSIEAGDNIDVMASWHGGRANGLRAPGQTQFALTNVRVLSVNQPPQVPGATSSSTTVSATGPTSANPTAGSVVLLVRYQQALIIQHLKDFGWQLSCVLRSNRAAEIKHFTTLPVTDKWFFVKSSNPFKANPGY